MGFSTGLYCYRALTTNPFCLMGSATGPLLPALFASWALLPAVSSIAYVLSALFASWALLLALSDIGLFCSRPFTISLSIIWALIPAFLLFRPCYRLFLLSGPFLSKPCYQYFCYLSFFFFFFLIQVLRLYATLGVMTDLGILFTYKLQPGLCPL